MRSWTVVAALVVGPLLLACSDSDESRVARELGEGLSDAGAFAGVLTDEEVECVGESVVDSLGDDDAASMGRDDPDDASIQLQLLSADEIDAIGAAMESCVSDLGSIVVDVVAAGTLEEADDELPVTEPEARCIGEAVAGDIGFTRLLQIRVDATAEGTDELSQLTAAEAEVYGRAYTSCLDVRAAILDGVRASGASEETVRCLDDAISDADIEERFVALFSGDETSAEEAFSDAIAACT